MNTPQQLRDRGEVGKLRGMELATGRQPDKVTAGKIALLRALLTSPDGTATIDDATTDLAESFDDGGKWRGPVCSSLSSAKLIESVSVEKSNRPSRHRGYVTRWRLVDRHKAQLALSRLVASQDHRVGLTSAMPDTSPINREAAPAPFAEELAGMASAQKTFPQFDEKKGFSNG